MKSSYQTTANARRIRHSLRRQRGISLFVVIIIVLLSMLLALWAARTALFNEIVVGNDADYQRAMEAAQALLQDAELDIRNEKADGTVCTPDAVDGKICRRTGVEVFPLEGKDVGSLIATLAAAPSGCKDGLCAKRAGRQDFWNTTSATSVDSSKGEARITDMAVSGRGARYGEYTGATFGDANNPINPILQDRSANDSGGWYWIEVLAYDESSKNAGLLTDEDRNVLQLNLKPDVVYRITALAYGRKSGTKVVLQEVYAPTKMKD